YTSARLKTQGKQSFTYGRIEARIKIPVGQGLWPAFWLLGTNITTVGWPKCGETDIMEHINSDSLIYGYTSARLKTQGKQSFTYGRIEARIKIPVGQGLWP
ncbi:glycoside hydrolase family 16 protein, partial [Chryseobacterium sp. CH1]|uniref:glycoside hydrolase family 16 protein n=1 Tax=Chryseobacterium sp. CH1 TaxID=713551 RepID=UPI00100BA61C